MSYALRTDAQCAMIARHGYDISSPSVLAIDTATNLCSVALVNDADIKEIQRDLPRAHNQHILTMIDELLEGQSLSEAVSVIACGVGPGSFTGIRVAVGVAQGLGWSLDLPIYPFVHSKRRRERPRTVQAILSSVPLMPRLGRSIGPGLHQTGRRFVHMTQPAVSKVADLTGPSGEAFDAMEVSKVVIAGDGAELITTEHSDKTFLA